MDFADKWAAFVWMFKKQLGRRNLSDEQKTYSIGKMYEAEKKSITNETGRNQYTKVVEDQNDLQPKPKSTAEKIGREVGVAEPTVKRAEKFAKGVDTLRKTNPEAADAVLKGNSGATKAEISELPNRTARNAFCTPRDFLRQLYLKIIKAVQNATDGL